MQDNTQGDGRPMTDEKPHKQGHAGLWVFTRATLWVVAGIATLMVAFVLYNAYVGVLPHENSWFYIALAGVLLGYAGNQWSLYKKGAPQPQRKQASERPTPELKSPHNRKAPPPLKQNAQAKLEPERASISNSLPAKSIFISYRRDDSADVTGRIYDRLKSHFGTDAVFKDVDSIPLGKDFDETINDAVPKASVVVVVIGKDWVGAKSSTVDTRIHEEADFVRTEVACALQQDKPVIPVFVSKGKMPMDSELPEDVRALTSRNGLDIRPDPDFDHCIRRLIRGIEQA